MTYWYLGLKRVVEIVREIYPDVPVILGGVYTTLMSEHAMTEIKPDHIITGPGELKVLKLLEKLLGKNETEFVKSENNCFWIRISLPLWSL